MLWRKIDASGGQRLSSSRQRQQRGHFTPTRRRSTDLKQLSSSLNNSRVSSENKEPSRQAQPEKQLFKMEYKVTEDWVIKMKVQVNGLLKNCSHMYEQTKLMILRLNKLHRLNLEEVTRVLMDRIRGLEQEVAELKTKATVSLPSGENKHTVLSEAKLEPKRGSEMELNKATNLQMELKKNETSILETSPRKLDFKQELQALRLLKINKKKSGLSLKKFNSTTIELKKHDSKSTESIKALDSPLVMAINSPKPRQKFNLFSSTQPGHRTQGQSDNIKQRINNITPLAKTNQDKDTPFKQLEAISPIRPQVGKQGGPATDKSLLRNSISLKPGSRAGTPSKEEASKSEALQGLNNCINKMKQILSLGKQDQSRKQ